MPDATAIAIVSVSVAGVASIIGPAVTARATSRGQRRRFAHERELHDRDDRRDRLDEVAEGLDELGRIASQQLHVLLRDGPADQQVFESTRKALGEYRRVNRALARLALRIDRSSGALAAARVSAEAFGDVLSAIGIQAAMGEYDDDYSHKELEALHQRGQEAALRFIDAARATMAGTG